MLSAEDAGLCAVLSGTLSADASVRHSSEAELHQRSSSSSLRAPLADALLRVCTAQQAGLAVQQAAAACVKKVITQPHAPLASALADSPAPVARLLADAAAKICRAHGSLSPPDGWSALPDLLAQRLSASLSRRNPDELGVVLDALHALTRRMKIEAASDALLQRDAQHLLGLLRAPLAQCLQVGGDIAGQAAAVYVNLVGSASQDTLAASGIRDFIDACLRAAPQQALLAAAGELLTIHPQQHDVVLPSLPLLAAVQPPTAEVLTILTSVAPKLDEGGALRCASYVVTASLPTDADTDLLASSPVEYIRGDPTSTRRSAAALLCRLLQDSMPWRASVLQAVLQPVQHMIDAGDAGQYAGALLILGCVARAALAVDEVGRFFTSTLIPKLGSVARAVEGMQEVAVVDALVFVGSFCRRHMPTEAYPHAMGVVAQWLRCDAEAVQLSASCALEKMLPCAPPLTQGQVDSVATPLFETLLETLDSRVAQATTRLISRNVGSLHDSAVLSALTQCIAKCCPEKPSGAAADPTTVHFLFEGVAALLVARPAVATPEFIAAMLDVSAASPAVSRYALHVVARGLLLLNEAALPLLQRLDFTLLRDPRHDPVGLYDVLTALATFGSPAALESMHGVLLGDEPYRCREGIRLVGTFGCLSHDPSAIRAVVARCVAVEAAGLPRWAVKPMASALCEVAAHHGGEALCGSAQEWAAVRTLVLTPAVVRGAGVGLGLLRVGCECFAHLGDADLSLVLKAASESIGFAADPDASSDASDGSAFGTDEPSEDEDDSDDEEGAEERASTPSQPVVLAALCGSPFPPPLPRLSSEAYVAGLRGKAAPALGQRLGRLPASPFVQQLIAML